MTWSGLTFSVSTRTFVIPAIIVSFCWSVLPAVSFTSTTGILNHSRHRTTPNSLLGLEKVNPLRKVRQYIVSRLSNIVQAKNTHRKDPEVNGGLLEHQFELFLVGISCCSSVCNMFLGCLTHSCSMIRSLEICSKICLVRYIILSRRSTSPFSVSLALSGVVGAELKGN